MLRCGKIFTILFAISFGLAQEDVLMMIEDTTAPQLTYIDIDPDTVNVTDTSAAITISFGAIDDMSGVSYYQARFSSPSGSQEKWVDFGFNGSVADTVTSTLNISQYSEAGLWELSYLYGNDQVNNQEWFSTDDLDSLEYQKQFYVISDQDTTAPQLTYIDIDPDTVNVTDTSAAITISFGAIDDMSGVSYYQARFSSPSGSQEKWVDFGFNGSVADTVTSTLNISQYSEAGLWELSYLYGNDQVNNQEWFSTDDLDSLEYQKQFYVINSTFQPQTKEELQTAVDLWISDIDSATTAYGHINNWDVSLITDMSELFRDQSFNSDISDWDVSNVTNMIAMFRYSTFNQDIGDWDVSNVTEMNALFMGTSFNHDIGDWNVSSVTNLTGTFQYNTSFNQDISGWDVSNVWQMRETFKGSSSFDQDISGWDVSNVTDWHETFWTGNNNATPIPSLSDENKCAIHSAWIAQNAAWPYDWSGLCISGDNYSLSFDGVDDYLDIPNLVDGSWGLTIEAWFKYENTDTWRWIYGGGSDWVDVGASVASGGNTIRYHFKTTDGSFDNGDGSIQLSPYRWYHFAMTYDGSFVKGYIDGQLDFETTLSGPVTTSTSQMIGAGYTNAGEFFKGNIDDVRIWNMPRTPSEIQDNMFDVDPASEIYLEGRWTFNEGTGDTTYGQSSNPHEAVIYGASWSTDVPFGDMDDLDDVAIDIYAPTGLAWDGSNYWVPGGWATGNASLLQIFKLDPLTGAKVDSIPAVSGWPGGITWDGVALWVSDYSGGPKLIAVDPADGSVNSSISVRYSSLWGGIATDGTYLYYGINGDNDAIYKVDPTNGSHVDSLDMSGYNVNGLAWDGTALWISDSNVDSLYRIMMDGTLLDARPAPGSEPAGLTIASGTLMNLDRSHNMIYAVDEVEEETGTANLRIWELSTAHHVQPGEMIGESIHLSIVNDGDADADTFSVGFYFSEDSMLTTDDVLLIGGREFIHGLAAGDTAIIDLPYEASVPELEDGIYHFGPIIDEMDEVEESYENDNFWWHYMRVGDPEFSLSLDGDADYVNFGDPEDESLDFADGPFSYSVWIKTYSAEFMQIISKRGGGGSYEMQMTNGIVSAGWVSASTMISDGEWHHLTYTWSGDSAKLYIDGSLESVGAPAEGETHFASSDGPLHLGADSYQGEYFTGNLDDFRMWNRELDASEIRPNMYFHPNWDDDLRPVAYWPINEGLGDTVWSWTDNEINGAIAGASWSDDVRNKPEGEIEVSITAARPESGYVWVGLWFPGSDYENRSPDIGRDSVFVNFADSSEHMVHFKGIPDGEGYIVRSIFDVVGSATSGTDNCDEGQDLWGESDFFSVSEGTTQTIGLVLNECSGPSLVGSPYFGIGWSRVRVWEDNLLNPDANMDAVVISGDQISVEAWVYPMSLPQHSYDIVLRPYYLTDERGAYGLHIDYNENGDPVYAFSLASDSTTNLGYVSTQQVNIGTWTHLSGTYDGNAIKLYVNGNLASEQTVSGNIGYGNTGFYIGGFLGNVDEFFHGMIREVRIWDTHLTQSEIQSGMDIQLSGEESGLRGYWPLDEFSEYNGYHPAALDLSPNANHLFVQGSMMMVDANIYEDPLIGPWFNDWIEPYAVADQSFHHGPVIDGWPLTWSLMEGPEGLTLDAGNGNLYWEPTQAQSGYHTVYLQAYNALGMAEGSLSIYVDQFPIESQSHNNSNVAMDVFNNGSLGRTKGDNSYPGFLYNGQDGLWEAALMIGVDPDSVSGTLYRHEFATRSLVTDIESSFSGFDQAFLAEYDDSRSHNSIGIHVNQRSHTKSFEPDNDYVLLDYELVNISGQDLSEVYVGLAMDWDVGDYNMNSGGYDTTRSLSYVYENQDGSISRIAALNDEDIQVAKMKKSSAGRNSRNMPYYYGAAALNANVSGHSIEFDNSDQSDSTLYYRMTHFESNDGIGEVRAYLSVGPFSIPADSSVNALFALIGGEDLADLQANADAAFLVGPDTTDYWYVSTDGSDIAGDGSEEHPFATIQMGINRSSNGDHVMVAEGTYVENINYNGKNISVIGEDRETTIIDGNQNGTTVLFENDETLLAILKNFTITNGSGTPDPTQPANPNAETLGGGIFLFGSASATLENIIVENNEAAKGGGVYNFADSLLCKNLIISNNVAYGGSAILAKGSGTFLENSLVINNNSNNDGNVINVQGNLVVNQVTVANNLGKIMYTPYHGPDLTVVNSIFNFPDNGGEPMEFNPAWDNSNFTFSYSSIKGGIDSSNFNLDPNYDMVLVTEGIVDIDPAFADTANGNYNLLASSMLINAGHPDSTDSDGTRADIGAYPYLNTYSGDNGWHVSTSGNDTSGTGDPGDPFRSIQGGINFANVADSVFVAAGTYMENILIPNFRSGLVIKSDFGPDTTVIDGNGLGTVIDAETCCPDNITIDGFTITGGQGENGNYYSGINATLITQSTFKNLILTGNSNGNVFSVSPHSNKLENILIADNTNTNFQLNENAFKALNIIGSAQDNESITVANVTIANNTNLAGLGIHQSHGQDLNAILLNTAVWGNDQSIIIHSDNNPYLSVNESLIEDDLGGVYHPEENATINWSVVISSAPHFYAPTEGDYSLSDWSPLIGAGAPQQTENDTVYYAPETDILGNPRPNPAGSNPDIGAYEHELGGFNNLPIVSLDLEIREHHDMVPLSFSMEDLDDDSMSYVFFYSLDSLEWDTAAVSEVTSPALPRGTAAGIGKGGTVVSLGAPRRFSTDMEMEWDSRLDLGDVHAMEVWLKTTVSDGELYTTKIAGPISVDNFIGSVVFIDSLSGEVSGPVNISYNLTDPTNDEYTMAIQYSTDGGSSWMEPTLSSPISDPLLPSEYSGERTWHTEIDLANADEQVLLALSITDGWQYGSADTVEFVVDNQFLIGLASYAPDTADKLNWYDNFVLFFPGEVDQTTLESGISLEGTVSGLVAASYNTATIGTQIRLSIIPDQALYGGEEVTLTISTEVKDTLGNPYDGNLNGDVDGDLDVTVLAYEMALLGDYNYSGLIQFNDLLDFQQAWWNPSTYGGRETGPAEGSAPNLSIQPDGVIDFEDLMVFVQMWNWSAGYVSNDGWLAKYVSSEFSGTTVEAVFPQKQIGEELETIHITMDVDSLKAIGSGEIMISYDPAVLEFLRIQNSLDEQWIILSNAADTDGMLRINLADFGRDENSGSRILNLEFKTLNEQNTFIFWQTDFRGRAAEIWEQSSGHLDFSTVPPLPQVYSLHQNFPNPFNPSTTIRYDLPEDAFVRLTVYDIRGREVAVLANGMKAAGYQTVVWNGRDSRGIPASAGIYFLRINTPAFHATKKMMLLK